MKPFLAPVSWLLACLFVLALASASAAAPTAEFWEELGGSASGEGLSASTRGVKTGNRHVSVAIGPDGRPVVAYADGDTIRVRRWTGTAWELIGPSGASGGLPQIVTDAGGRMYLAWRQFAGATLSWEVFLLARDWNGAAWQPLGTSASGGGITGAEGPASVPAFSLVLDADGTPYVAYQSTTLATTDFTTQATGLERGTHQIYVRRWDGSTWAFVGSGREGGGASHALSFRVAEPGRTTTFASHGAEHPALAIGHDGHPIVAFVYTSRFTGGNPPEFNGENDDMYAVRWDGTAWQPVGPALPTAPVGAGLGAPGGISNTGGWTREVMFDWLVHPSLIVDHAGAPVLAWGETIWNESPTTDGWRRISVRRWNGSAWQGLGSPGGDVDLIAYAYDTSLALGVDGPILAWPRGGGEESWVAVLAFDPQADSWREMGLGSVGPTGISGPGDRAFNPRVAVSAAGIPTVAWIDRTPAVAQAYLRTFQERVLPDLSVTSLTAPATAAPGASFDVTTVVRNGGSAGADPSMVHLYLAAGTERAPADVLLGSTDVPALPIGGSATLTVTVTVPAGTASGTYRILAVVDEAAAAEELNEVNNARASSPVAVAPPPAPDLDMTALAAPERAQVGGPLVVQHTVLNAGDAPSGAITLQFFLSADDALGGDVLLGTRALGSLAPGASSTLETALTVPAGTAAPAVYRVIVLATLTAGTDRDATNDAIVSAPVDVAPPPPDRPDLIVTDVGVPASVAAGRTLAVTHTVRNVGALPAGASTVRVYLSSDAVLDTGDALLGSRSVGALAVDGASTAVSTVTVPAGTAPGPYRVLVVADALEQQAEADEGNNTGVSSAVTVTILGPDLVMTALSVPTVGAAGRPLAISHTVRNAGTAAARAFSVRFFLSADATLDEGDVLLGARSVRSLAVGASSSAVSRFTIPAATPVPSSHHVIAVADALGQQAETDETNNTAASAAMTLAPWRSDLTLSALSVPANAAAGRPLAISHTVRNVGVAPAGAAALRFFLSSDGTLDDGDVPLGGRTVPALAAGASSRAVTTVIVPAGTPVPSSHRVIGVVDALGQHAELDETNNALASAEAVAIGPYQPDLRITRLAAPAAGATGRPLAITHAVHNAGVARAGASTVRFFLSTDAVLDDADVPLGGRTVGSLAPGATSTAVTTVTVPAGTAAPAAYQVIAVVDALGQHAELDETNNTLASDAVAIGLFRAELAPTALGAPDRAAAGRPVAIANAVHNAGPAPAGRFAVRLFLSADAALDEGDVLLGGRTVGSLAAGATSRAATRVVIPAETAVAESYHVIAAVDALAQQTELDEANNVMASATAVEVTAYEPDLALTAVRAPADAAPGRALAITHTTGNVGTAPTRRAFALHFYLSSDATLDETDVPLGSRRIAGRLRAGAARVDTTRLTVPADAVVPDGYHVIGVVDALDQTETSRANNVAASLPSA